MAENIKEPTRNPFIGKKRDVLRKNRISWIGYRYYHYFVDVDPSSSGKEMNNNQQKRHLSTYSLKP